MPCISPMQGFFTINADGKQKFVCTNSYSKQKGVWNPNPKLDRRYLDNLETEMVQLPCNQCMWCRLAKSREWATRSIHEAQMYEENCFVTLTFNNYYLSKLCPNNSLDPEHMTLWLKKLRRQIDYYGLNDSKEDKHIRYFYCGEYGDQTQRPHYHALIFNFEPKDLVLYKRKKAKDGKFYDYFNSDFLSRTWSYGHVVVSRVTYESAAYVARYCTKKITGKSASAHYSGRHPEFCRSSKCPGLGKIWFDKFGLTDVYPSDQCVIRGGVVIRPPKYYDKLLERVNPDLFKEVKEKRRSRMTDEKLEQENSLERIVGRNKYYANVLKKLTREIELSEV